MKKLTLVYLSCIIFFNSILFADPRGYKEFIRDLPPGYSTLLLINHDMKMGLNGGFKAYYIDLYYKESWRAQIKLHTRYVNGLFCDQYMVRFKSNNLYVNDPDSKVLGTWLYNLISYHFVRDSSGRAGDRVLYALYKNDLEKIRKLQ